MKQLRQFVFLKYIPECNSYTNFEQQLPQQQKKKKKVIICRKGDT
jgi:hypothetical protein